MQLTEFKHAPGAVVEGKAIAGERENQAYWLNPTVNVSNLRGSLHYRDKGGYL